MTVSFSSVGWEGRKSRQLDRALLISACNILCQIILYFSLFFFHLATIISHEVSLAISPEEEQLSEALRHFPLFYW